MLNVAYSPCPNDTFIFHAWVAGKLPHAPAFQPVLADVQELNQKALQNTYPVTKVSFFCLGHILENYIMLPSGAALGRNCGPKIIAKKPYEPQELSKLRIAIPGMNTTAHLLLNLLCTPPREKIFCLYHEINHLIDEGSADCGLIIHESRFTFERDGFHEIADLGVLWEKRYQCALPLGCIAGQRSLGAKQLQSISEAIRQSLEWAWAHPEDSQGYIQEHSIEKDPAVIRDHIDLYVNNDSVSISPSGIQSVEILLSQAREKKLIPNYRTDWLLGLS